MEDKLIVIANETYTSALALQGYLNSNGIECYLKNVNLIQPNISDNVKVQIREADAEKAIKLLVELDDPGRGEHNVRRILVPIDFSEHSTNAALFALRIAHVYGAELKLLHVFNSPIVDLIPFSDAASVQIDVDLNFHTLQKNAKKQLVKAFEQIKRYARENGMDTVKIGYSLREGFPSYGIIDSCRRHKPGIVIMGTKGEGFRSNELVGDVAMDVAKEVNIPLLVIPEKAVLKDIYEVKNVLYAARLDDNDYAAIRKLAVILSAFKVNIWCINCTDEPENAIARARLSSLKDYAKKTIKKANIQFELVKGKYCAETFRGFISGRRIDLFAVTMHKRNLLSRIFNPSLTRKMLAEADIPMLIFPD